MVARRITSVAVALLSAVLGLNLVVGMVEGLDRESERVTASVSMMLLYEAVGAAALAAVVFTITRAVRVWRGEPMATMVISLFGALIAWMTCFVLLAVAFSS
jgi:hypothetical protein